jgi:hypothetical protein
MNRTESEGQCMWHESSESGAPRSLAYHDLSSAVERGYALERDLHTLASRAERLWLE